MPRSRQVAWLIGHKKKWRPRGHEVDVGSLHTYPRTAGHIPQDSRGRARTGRWARAAGHRQSSLEGAVLERGGDLSVFRRTVRGPRMLQLRPKHCPDLQPGMWFGSLPILGVLLVPPQPRFCVEGMHIQEAGGL